MRDPFVEEKKEDWRQIRDDLISEHPLSLEEIKSTVLTSFKKLLDTKIGDPSDNLKIIKDVSISNQVMGAFLETIILNEFKKLDDSWRQGSSAEKDMIYEDDEIYSTEIKTSGQCTTEIFGNRSYSHDSTSAKKSKSGYYITINFHNANLFLIRFGWIDHRDWSGQDAPTGQAATLSKDIYKYKLKVINDEYIVDNAPLDLLYGIGPKTLENVNDILKEYEIQTVGDFLSIYENDDEDLPENKYIKKVVKSAKEFPENTIEIEDCNQNKIDNYF